MRDLKGKNLPWGYAWRSSKTFILAAGATAMLTDMFLHDFLVSILPTLLEDRLLLDPQLVQKASLALLAESALVSFTISPFIHHHAHWLENDNWLLAGLIGELLGSMAIASANSLYILFSGRFVQAVANTSVGILGLASLSRKVPTDELDKINGIITVALAMGSTGGPLIAGSLLQLAGYWRAWNYAVIASLVGIGLQFLMVDTTKSQMHGRRRPADENSSEAPVVDEQSPLIPTLVTENSAEIQGLLSSKKFDMTLYVYLFRNSQYVGGIVSSICYAVVSSSFSTTLPLHVRHVFDWGSLPTGLLFGAIQGPNAFLGVSVAWLKKRIGTRHPTTFGFAILAIMLWLIGIPGDEKFPWFNRESRDVTLYVTSVIGAGVSMSLLNGVGMMEAANAVCELEIKHPEVFGSREGYNRAVFVTRMSWTLGTFVGPILSGTLSERIGYYAMNCILAGICAMCSLLRFGT